MILNLFQSPAKSCDIITYSVFSIRYRVYQYDIPCDRIMNGYALLKHNPRE